MREGEGVGLENFVILINASASGECRNPNPPLFIHFQNNSTLKCLNIGTPKIINFPFFPNGKLMILGVPIFEHTIKFNICNVPKF